ncbi:MAG: hypothetical protein UY70_C0001G0030 [Candidatus Kaiserbacteria bacterium GW2011_GWB1_52_6]|uniref:Uncharacterized protein n=3 Tax=Candidatus Kaiseribacteriota TaxID=1752734 RepID=A0A0G1XIY4_9BACT|nr:MAG: hypothetical protein UY67_C0007G0030 [Candidatus Kaiserbacteria bacterium GW2011_GWA2_52_12]KKW28194.1 MAG: hypothetical protein UY70_C0001G0030 [Candidatus Kaiserbacteria bacterium GW2011_GWB1_52_6]KKW31163.1 MAG: hypothetical protein UY74_C0022G0019 [Candidatus Kaiserbacteria bacterium GW2011_GWC2_52_8b]
MAEQSAIDKLKDKPKDERVVVASGIAISVVVILLVAWAFFFFRNIQKGTQQLNLSGGVQNQFNSSSVKQAQDQLNNIYNGTAQNQQDLQDIRNSNTSDQMQTQQQVNVQPGADTDQFTNTTTN